MEIRRIILFLLAIAMPIIAMADCYTFLRQKAIEAYNQGEYDRAKNTFQAAKEDCPDAPLNNDIDSWIQKCESAKKQQQQKTNQGSSSTNSQSSSYLRVDNSTANSTKYLMSTSSSITIRVSCSSSYSVLNIPSWCWITNKTSTSFTLNYQANPNAYTRYGSIDVNGGGTSIRLSLEQAAKSSSSSSNVSTLKANKTSVYASANGGTEYITITSKKAWEIQFPSGGMYTAKRIGDIVEVVISANPSTNTRTDYFNIRTTDGKETVKISLSQYGKSSSTSSYSNNYSSSTRRNSSSSKYQQYTRYCGDYEIIWGGLRAGICTGAFYGIRVFSFRLGPVQINPAELTFDYGFIKKPGYYVSDYYHDYYYDKVWVEDYNVFNISYTPSIDLLIPFQEDAAFYFGGGPSIVWSSDPKKDWPYVWADVSAGIHWHWGYSASSDFFVRYNGNFMIGISIQWSSQY